MTTDTSPVTQPGDLWLLGPHRVLCGDARNAGDVQRLVNGAVINLAFTSPPYASRRAYDPESGFRPVRPDDYVDWFAPVAAAVQSVLADDGSWFVNIKASTDGTLLTHLYVHELVIAHVREWGWNYATEFCWKRPGVPKRVILRFKNQFEPVYQFTKGRWKIRPDRVRIPTRDAVHPAGPGQGLREWRYTQGSPGSVSFGGSVPTAGLAYPGNLLPAFSSARSSGHPGAFPVGLPQFFVKAYTDPGDWIYDPFMGSGSTLIAGDRQGRLVCGMEISPRYVDLICERYLSVAGFRPVNERTGREYRSIKEST